MPSAYPRSFSPLLLARTAGWFSLLSIATGAFDLGYVRSVVFVAGNAAATLSNLQKHESLFRAGIGAHLVCILCNIPVEIIYFFLFRRVNALVAAVPLCAGLIGTAIEGLDLVNSAVPLTIALGAGTPAGFSQEQTQSLTFLALQLQDAGLLISFVFYGIDEMAGGFLIFRSGFLPKILGILLATAGFCYFSHGLASFLVPALDARWYPAILYPCLPGEGLIALWLATRGLNLHAWIDRSGASGADGLP